MGVKHVVSITGWCTYGLVFRSYVAALVDPLIDLVYVDAYGAKGDKWSLSRLHEQSMCAVRNSLIYEVGKVPGEFFNPRQEDSRVGKIVAFHHRYDFNETCIESSWFSSMEELREYLVTPTDEQYKDVGEGVGAVAVLPLYMLDHGGLSVSCSPFSCPWDSGQFGYIYLDQEGLEKIGDSGRSLEDILRQEVEVWGKYLSGEVYEYMITSSKYNVDHIVGSEYSSGYMCEDSCVGDAKRSLARVKAELCIRSKLVAPAL